MSNMGVFLLRCAVQTYAWGKIGNDSEVAKLSQKGDSTFELKPDVPYAELWMGTHPKGPSMIAETSQPLSDWLAHHPDAAGDKVRQQFPTSGQLPFLFKVLSVNKSLSIQAHPNKSLAEKLHAEVPDKYPDDNHKPEMAIALTPFEAMCGFRPVEEIVAFMDRVPEFNAIVGQPLVDKLRDVKDAESQKAALQDCFTALMTCPVDVVKEKLNSLVQRLTKAKENGQSTDCSLGELVLRLNSQFPGDAGCFCAYFLNKMLLQPGEAMFLGANVPHAYLSGDCLECMACSDNVVRAGLTPKFKDVPTLCSMLTYQCKPAEENKYGSQPHPSDPFVTLYDPPVPDFTVARVKVPSGQKYSLADVDSASILLVIGGEATGSSSSLAEKQLHLHRGVVLFISANQKLDISVSGSEDLLLFRSYNQL